MTVRSNKDIGLVENVTACDGSRRRFFYARFAVFIQTRIKMEVAELFLLKNPSVCLLSLSELTQPDIWRKNGRSAKKQPA